MEVNSDPHTRPSLRSRYGTFDYQGFESRRTVSEEIMKALVDETTHVIGIYGMEGVGKTAMAAEIGDQAMRGRVFDDVLMVVVSRNQSVRDIQDELVAQLGLERFDGTESEIASDLCFWLKNGKHGKKILVILDGVWEELNFKDIGIPYAVNGGKGCKILLTSRKKNVFCTMQVNKDIMIQVLSDEEAWSFFESRVRGAIDSPHMKDIAKDVCRACGGLPIAILAMSAVLNYVHKSMWVVVLKQLRASRVRNINGIDDKVCASLAVSYYHLKGDEKYGFLHCCLLREDSNIPIDSLMRIGRGMGMFDEMRTLGATRNRVHTLVDNLKTKCLLLKGKDELHFKMHNVVRDVAMSIALEGQHVFLVDTGGNLKEWPQQGTYNSYTSMSLIFDHISDFPNGLECPKLQTLMLKSRSMHSPGIPDTFFNGMSELRALAFEKMKMTALPPSMQVLDDLRVLCLEDCDLSDISLVGKLKKLEMLILTSSNIHALPTEVGNLVDLRLLDLRNCKDLKTISPNIIRGLSRLEELFFPREYKMWRHCKLNHQERIADLAELEMLSELESLEIHVPKFEMLPPALSFPFWGNLTSFKISINVSFELHEYEKRKNIMKLNNVLLTHGVDVLLKRVEDLYVHGFRDLKYFNLRDDDRESFSHLEYLQASSCEGVQEFLAKALERPFYHRHSSLEPFVKLSVLQVWNCSLKYLITPCTVKALGQLQKLTIMCCESLEAIVLWNNAILSGEGCKEVMDMIIFPQLEILEMQELPRLASFYPKIEQTCVSEESFYFLLQPLFNEMVAFPNLKLLKIEKVGDFKEIGFEYLPVNESFSKLRELSLHAADNLSIIGSYTLIKRFQCLQVLRVVKCGSLRAVINFGRQVNGGVEIVSANHEKAVEGIDQTVLSLADRSHPLEFPCLRELYIKDCGTLEEFCSNESFQAKEGPNTVAANSVRPFFNDMIAIPFLEKIQLQGLIQLRSILWSSDLPSMFFSKYIKMLEVTDCPNLMSLAPSMLAQRFQNLQDIRVQMCISLEALFKYEGSSNTCVDAELRMINAAKGKEKEKESMLLNLPWLKEMKLRQLPHLVNYCESESVSCIFELSALEALLIDSCSEHILHSFFDEKTELRSLQYLNLSRIDKLKEICSSHISAHSFCNLTTLIIDSCPNLVRAISPYLLPRLQQLSYLSVSDCGSLRALIGIGAGEAHAAATHNNENVLTLPELKKLELCDLVNFQYLLKLATGSISPEKILGFHNLTYIEIVRCNGLKNLFSSASTAAAFGLKLETLILSQCEMIEEIISSSTGKEDTAADALDNDVKIIFPQLVELVLIDLPNLTSLCPSGYRLLRASQSSIHIRGCPNVPAEV